RTATLRHIKGSRFVPDYFAEEIEWRWVIFPWNYVEDLCNLIPKALVFKNDDIDFEETMSRLKELFSVTIDTESLRELCAECKIRGLLKK
ncbi:MAG: phosphoribosyltransferase, partial [Candidatus Bathyarchaeia archaeon]